MIEFPTGYSRSPVSSLASSSRALRRAHRRATKWSSSSMARVGAPRRLALPRRQRARRPNEAALRARGATRRPTPSSSAPAPACPTQSELAQLRQKRERATGAQRQALEARIARKNDALSSAKAERDAALKRLDALKAEQAEAVERAEQLEARAARLEAGPEGRAAPRRAPRGSRRAPRGSRSRPRRPIGSRCAPRASRSRPRRPSRPSAAWPLFPSAPAPSRRAPSAPSATASRRASAPIAWPKSSRASSLAGTGSSPSCPPSASAPPRPRAL